MLFYAFFNHYGYIKAREIRDRAGTTCRFIHIDKIQLKQIAPKGLQQLEVQCVTKLEEGRFQ